MTTTTNTKTMMTKMNGEGIEDDDEDNTEETVYFQSTINLTPSATQLGMKAALAYAGKQNWQVTVCICDGGGTPLHVQRTAKAFPASYDIACGKAKSAALFAKNTGDLETAVNVTNNNEGGGRSALLSSPFLLMRGGIPLLWEGQVVGAVGVSGVQAHQDEAIAQAAVDAIGQVLTTTTAAAAGVPSGMTSRL